MAPEDTAAVRAAVRAMKSTRRPPADRLAAGLSPAVRDALGRTPLREHVTTSPDYPLVVDRTLALAGSWYELFPRSHGAVFDTRRHSWRSGTLKTAAKQLAPDRGDGLRRRLPDPDPPDRHDLPQGPQQLA